MKGQVITVEIERHSEFARFGFRPRFPHIVGEPPRGDVWRFQSFFGRQQRITGAIEFWQDRNLDELEMLNNLFIAYLVHCKLNLLVIDR